MLDWLWDWLDRVWDQLTGWFWDIFNAVAEVVFGALIAVLSAIPVPDWAEGLDLGWIPASMAYWLEPFQVGFGLACITGGYLIRFVVRRIPFIG